MDPEKKREYYQNNRNTRLSYQKKYYHKNKKWIKRKRALKQENSPAWKEEQREYNRLYYLRNREQIQAQRAEKANLWAVRRSESVFKDIDEKTAQRFNFELKRLNLHLTTIIVIIAPVSETENFLQRKG